MSKVMDEEIPLLPTDVQSAVKSSRTPDRNERVISLDQYRGFVILGSLIIPLLGRLNGMPSVFRHNGNFFSLADTTQPLFYLAIGHSMQLTLSRLRSKKGMRAVVRKQLERSRTLYVISMLVRGIDNQNSWSNLCQNWYKLPLQLIWCGRIFDTLAFIGIAQLIILPVITRSIGIRACYMISIMSLFIVMEWTFWLKIQWQYSAGMLEAVSWVFVILAGTFLNDWNQWIRKIPLSVIVGRKRRIIKAIISLLIASGLCWLSGYLISGLPANWSPSCHNRTGAEIVCPNMSLPSIPFVPPKMDVITIWTMSQWVPSLTNHLTGIGYGLLVYLFWFVVSDLKKVQLNVLNTLSTHSLLMFILRDYGFRLASSIIPSDSPLYMLPVLLLIGVGANLIIATYLQSNNINLRI